MSVAPKIYDICCSEIHDVRCSKSRCLFFEKKLPATRRLKKKKNGAKRQTPMNKTRAEQVIRVYNRGSILTEKYATEYHCRPHRAGGVGVCGAPHIQLAQKAGKLRLLLGM